MSEVQTFSYSIWGRVQGVGYRAWMTRVARDLGLKGFVCNRPDGSVYAEATGPVEALRRLEELCWVGPAAARVERVLIEEVSSFHTDDFYIKRV
ncbi:MAG: acylphosphatase [Flavobacteriales bacterium]|nr:acylphosphatase [Flavobacteriales bacterium]MDW8410926.1 acylphosphatase [Flavobacteriales bacterium]